MYFGFAKWMFFVLSGLCSPWLTHGWIEREGEWESLLWNLKWDLKIPSLPPSVTTHTAALHVNYEEWVLIPVLLIKFFHLINLIKKPPRRNKVGRVSGRVRRTKNFFPHYITSGKEFLSALLSLSIKSYFWHKSVASTHFSCSPPPPPPELACFPGKLQGPKSVLLLLLFLLSFLLRKAFCTFFEPASPFFLLASKT